MHHFPGRVVVRLLSVTINKDSSRMQPIVQLEFEDRTYYSSVSSNPGTSPLLGCTMEMNRLDGKLLYIRLTDSNRIKPHDTIGTEEVDISFVFGGTQPQRKSVDVKYNGEVTGNVTLSIQFFPIEHNTNRQHGPLTSLMDSGKRKRQSASCMKSSLMTSSANKDLKRIEQQLFGEPADDSKQKCQEQGQSGSYKIPSCSNPQKLSPQSDRSLEELMAAIILNPKDSLMRVPQKISNLDLPQNEYNVDDMDRMLGD